MSEEGGSAGGREPEPPRRLEEWLRPLLDDPLLWPVLVAVVLSAASIGSAALSAALQRRNYFAMAAVAVCAASTLFGLEDALRQRRLDTLGVLVLAVWLLSALGAAAIIALG